MCLIVFAYKTVPGYPLILAANRDEFYGRPTRPAGYWKTNPSILAGKDLKAGGTWLGIHKNGRFSAVTNYRDMSDYKPDAKSRGGLVHQFLESTLSPRSYMNEINTHGGQYNGFNLLAGNRDQLFHYSNKENRVNPVEPGIHAISNALLNTPWPKVREAKERFSTLLSEEKIAESNLFDLLASTKTWPLDQLPQTGLVNEMEEQVSATFIRTPDYGTRCSTLLYIKSNGLARFVERTFKPGSTDVEEENSFNLTFM